MKVSFYSNKKKYTEEELALIGKIKTKITKLSEGEDYYAAARKVPKGKDIGDLESILKGLESGAIEVSSKKKKTYQQASLFGFDETPKAKTKKVKKNTIENNSDEINNNNKQKNNTKMAKDELELNMNEIKNPETIKDNDSVNDLSNEYFGDKTEAVTTPVEEVIEKPKKEKNIVANEEFSPFDEDTEKRGYSSLEESQMIDTPIPEPQFDNISFDVEELTEDLKNPQPMGGGADSFDGGGFDGGGGGGSSPIGYDEDDFGGGLNPGLEDASPKEKRKAGKFLAQSILGWYEKLVMLAQGRIIISEDKKKKLELDGSVDFGLKIPLNREQTKTITIPELFNEYNESVEEAFQVDPEFIEKMLPLLTEYFAQKGWGMTLEQRIIALAAEEVVGKAGLAFMLIKNQRELIGSVRELTSAYYSSLEAEKGEKVQSKPARKEPKDDFEYIPKEAGVSEIEDAEVIN